MGNIPNIVKVTPTLEDMVQDFIDISLLEINTCMPATVVSYDSSSQTCVVQPSFKRTTVGGEVVNRAKIEDVPVVFPRSGAFGLTVPVVAGDTVLLLFSQRSLDDWIDNGGEVELTDFRLHDITDAIALVGFFPTSKALDPPPATDATEIRGDKILLGKSGASAEPMVLGTTLQGNLEDLIDAIADLIALITNGATLGTGYNATPVKSTIQTAAVESALNSVKSALANQNSDFIFGEKS